MTNILEKIIQEKKDTLKDVKKYNSLSFLEDKIKNINTFLDFKNVISNNKKISIISEIKKASPLTIFNYINFIPANVWKFVFIILIINFRNFA